MFIFNLKVNSKKIIWLWHTENPFNQRTNSCSIEYLSTKFQNQWEKVNAEFQLLRQYKSNSGIWLFLMMLFHVDSEMYEGVSTSFRNHPKVKEPEITMQSYTFFRLFIDCPQTKIVTWCMTLKFIIEESISRNLLCTTMHINVWAPPEMYYECIWSKWDQQNWFLHKMLV